MKKNYHRNGTFFKYEHVTATKVYFSAFSQREALIIYLNGNYFTELQGEDLVEFEREFADWKRFHDAAIQSATYEQLEEQIAELRKSLWDERDHSSRLAGDIIELHRQIKSLR